MGLIFRPGKVLQFCRNKWGFKGSALVLLVYSWVSERLTWLSGVLRTLCGCLQAIRCQTLVYGKPAAITEGDKITGQQDSWDAQSVTEADLG